MRKDHASSRWTLLFFISGFLVLLLLRISERQLVPANLISLDLLSRKFAGEELLDPRIANKVSETLLLNQHRVAIVWLCEYGNSHMCENIYGHISDNPPIDRMVAFHLAGHLANWGRPSEAIHLWSQVDSGRYWAYLGSTESGCTCKNSDDSLCLLYRAVEVSPGDGVSHYLLGDRLNDCEQWAQAIRSLTFALDSGDLIQMDQVSALLDRGMAIYYSGGGLEAAETDITRAIQLQPDNPWPWLRLCSLYRQEGQYYKAAMLCTQAIQLAPELGYAYYYRGRAWQAASALDLAITDYEQALKLDPMLTAAGDRLNRIRAAK